MSCIYSFRGEFVKTMFGRTYDVAGSSTCRARHTVPRRSTHSVFKRRYLIRVVVEVVHELRDANDDDEIIVRPPHISIEFRLSNQLRPRQNELINDDYESMTTSDRRPDNRRTGLRAPRERMRWTFAAPIKLEGDAEEDEEDAR